MTISRHITEYAGLPIAEFTSRSTPDVPAAGHAWRVRAEGYKEGAFAKLWARFLDTVDTAEVTALVVGYWGPSERGNANYPVSLVADAADRFPNLRSLFFGEIVLEESEVSWIEHGDIGPLLAAFPDLERFDVRGSEGLRLEPLKSDALKTLRFETGGLPADVVRAVGASELPALEHLDLWLGTDEYGGSATVADLAPVLGGERFPALRHLGLENAEIADEIAAALAGAPVVARLESLSLALGALGDEGAEALLAGQPLTHLRKLDLHHHFVTDPMIERVRAALPGVDVDLAEQEDPDEDWRFVAVAE
ncbi:STM4015 family protein [Actinomadura rayongensis]|uniref:Leucine-rich repeat domain-containing protein n=1 Tax=Actinomadura rayongensis TaxID=1429076 RepID=A0A6I4WAC6_9ACTN|nr:STM4015 family protein [Actinomadura rayongensis]MXQ66541.1 leucine-rich repeat domain-containing protein [Actinomadura rayongensis]